MLCISHGLNSKLEQSLIDNNFKLFNLHRFQVCISLGPNSKLEKSLIDKCISKCLICTGFMHFTWTEQQIRTIID